MTNLGIANLTISPAQIRVLPEYEHVQSENNFSSVEEIWRHIETQTCWRCSYRVREHDDDQNIIVNWIQVYPKVISKTIYSTQTMMVVHSNQPHGVSHRSSIMLCGPTPRRVDLTKDVLGVDVLSWRPEAIKILQNIGFDGLVLVPEREDWAVRFDYIDQVKWEKQALEMASIIAFWVPRNMVNMFGLTTNIEFGYCLAKRPEQVIYGRPHGAPHTQYLDWLIKEEKENCVIYNDLESLLIASVNQIEKEKNYP